jgi:hypothetical protein
VLVVFVLLQVLDLGRSKTCKNMKIIEQMEKLGVSGVCFVTNFGFRTFQNMYKYENYWKIANWVSVVFVLFQF